MQITHRGEFSKLIDHYGLKVGAEIGVQAGCFSECLLNSKIEKLYLIDCWEHQDNYYDIANVSNGEQKKLFDLVSNKFKNDSRVEIIKSYSIDASERFSHNFFDFIYLDADHKYNAVKKDIKVWYKRLKNKGIISGHDYLDGIHNRCEFGVKSAVDEFFLKNNQKVNITTHDHPWASWYVIKNET